MTGDELNNPIICKLNQVAPFLPLADLVIWFICNKFFETETQIWTKFPTNRKHVLFWSWLQYFTKNSTRFQVFTKSFSDQFSDVPLSLNSNHRHSCHSLWWYGCVQFLFFFNQKIGFETWSSWTNLNCTVFDTDSYLTTSFQHCWLNIIDYVQSKQHLGQREVRWNTRRG